jgi:hypothetical protein
MLVDLDVLINVEMSLKDLVPLLDPVLGHNREPPREVKR